MVKTLIKDQKLNKIIREIESTLIKDPVSVKTFVHVNKLTFQFWTTLLLKCVPNKENTKK